MSDYAKELGARLRAVRCQQQLSLHGVEAKSQGRWKAVVVGSYERGDRSVTVQRLTELAVFYGVPVSQFLPNEQPVPRSADAQVRVVLDLERLQELPIEDALPLARYAARIQSQRGDYNGRVLSIRHEDLRSLAVMYDSSSVHMTEMLRAWDLLSEPQVRQLT